MRPGWFGKSGKTFVGHGYYADIGFDGAEGEICTLRLCVRKTVEKGGLAYIGKSYYTTL